MRHPFQSLLACPFHANRQEDLLIAAAGPSLYAYTLNQGKLVSSWHQTSTTSSKSDKERPPPQKRQKLSSTGPEITDAPTSQPAIQSEKKNRPAKQESELPSVVQLATTSKGTHIVAVTDKDKCLRVFALGPSGQLTLLSERFMPKRPSAVAITDDDATIICADKFGDVYALPLLENTSGATNISLREPHPKEKRKISANLTTVHTARNRQALESQLREAKSPEPKSIDFSCQLLLGHVSMITDLILATIVEPGSSESRLRRYIVTCDRDEHIRVSRAIPQSHIIEGYCLGHKQFVSRICVPRSRPNILISGGGDDFLCIWDWLSGNVLQRLDLQVLVQQFLNSNADLLNTYVAEGSNSKISNMSQSQNGDESLNQDTAEINRATSTLDVNSSPDRPETLVYIAVTGIWSLNQSSESGEANVQILVACEGIPALLAFHLTPDNLLTHDQTLPLKGNSLDVAIYEGLACIVVSIVNIHKPCSKTHVRDSLTNSDILLQCFSLRGNGTEIWWEEDAKYLQIEDANRQGSFDVDASLIEQMSGLLYTVENLRKRGTED